MSIIQKKVFCEKYDKSRFVGSLFVLSILLVSMHALHGMLMIDVKWIFVISLFCLFLIGYIKSGLGINKKYLLYALMLFVVCMLGTIYSKDMYQVTIGITGAVMMLAVSVNYKIAISQYVVKCLVVMDLIFLIGAWVGFAYALAGGQSNYYVINQETNMHLYMYLLTFTNAVIGNIIRPSAVFDEPGAFALFSVLVAAINDMVDGKKSLSITILVMNLITFSLMAVMAIILYYIIAINKRNVSIRKILPFIFGFCVVVVMVYMNYDIVYNLIINRLIFDNDGIFENNRMSQIDLFLSEINLDIFMQGYQVKFGSYFGGDMSSNPFTILFVAGVFVWLPYVLLLVWLLYVGLRYGGIMRYSSIIFAALLLQRPYIYSIYWGLFLCYYLVVLVEYKKRCDYAKLMFKYI